MSSYGLSYGVTGPGYTQNPSGIGFSPNPAIGTTITSKPASYMVPNNVLPGSTLTLTVYAYPPAPAAPITTSVTFNVW